jgi:hypothetical protein
MNKKGREILLGDMVQGAAKRLGLQKLAQKYEQVTKKPCGCGKRKAALNELHRKIKRVPKNETT